jgi:hypothetical protein
VCSTWLLQRWAFSANCRILCVCLTSVWITLRDPPSQIIWAFGEVNLDTVSEKAAEAALA